MVSTTRHPGHEAGIRVLVAGAGGAIGSFVLGLLARTPGVSGLILVDPDTYETHNLASQDIAEGDVGKAKVDVQARRVRRINPHLEMTAVRDTIANVPFGLVRSADVILAGLDSLGARRDVNRAAWRAGVPLIDAGVLPDKQLVRVSLYQPAEGATCLECAWDERHEQVISIEYSCAGVAATRSPAYLGAAAASLAVGELAQRFIQTTEPSEGKTQVAGENEADQPTGGVEIVHDLAGRASRVTRLTRNPACRFDHATWDISRQSRLTPGSTVAEAVSSLPNGAPIGGAPSEGFTLGVDGKSFVRAVTCPACSASRRVAARLEHRLGRRRCGTCGGEMEPVGFEMTSRFDVGTAPKRTLRSLGLRGGDVVQINAAGRTARVLLADDVGLPVEAAHANDTDEQGSDSHD